MQDLTLEHTFVALVHIIAAWLKNLLQRLSTLTLVSPLLHNGSAHFELTAHIGCKHPPQAGLHGLLGDPEGPSLGYRCTFVPKFWDHRLRRRHAVVVLRPRRWGPDILSFCGVAIKQNFWKGLGLHRYMVDQRKPHKQKIPYPPRFQPVTRCCFLFWSHTIFQGGILWTFWLCKGTSVLRFIGGMRAGARFQRITSFTIQSLGEWTWKCKRNLWYKNWTLQMLIPLVGPCVPK